MYFFMLSLHLFLEILSLMPTRKKPFFVFVRENFYEGKLKVSIKN